MVFDKNNKVVGTFYTDDRGLIDFSSILTEGRYTIRETRPQEGYYPDNKPRTVEFVAGGASTLPVFLMLTPVFALLLENSSLMICVANSIVTSISSVFSWYCG